jgi:hypothetical protein
MENDSITNITNDEESKIDIDDNLDKNLNMENNTSEKEIINENETNKESEPNKENDIKIINENEQNKEIELNRENEIEIINENDKETLKESDENRESELNKENEQKEIDKIQNESEIINENESETIKESEIIKENETIKESELVKEIKTEINNQDKKETMNENGEEKFISCFKEEWIESLKINYPKEMPGFFNSYLVYEIEYKLNDEIYKIKRRYNDFLLFRGALKKYLPCKFIPNVHKKQVFNNKDPFFICERVNSLETFLVYLLERREFFNCVPFWMFFDKDKKETEVGDDLNLISLPKISQIIKNYLNIYPETEELENVEMSCLKKVKKFKNKIGVNIEFYNQLSAMSNKVISQYEEIQKQEMINFYNLVIIPLNDQNENFANLQTLVEKISKINLEELIRNFQKEVENISLKFDAFKDIYNDFETCEKLFLEKKNKIIILNQKFADLRDKVHQLQNIENPTPSNIKEKDILETEIKNIEQDMKFKQISLNKVEKLLSIFTFILNEEEIPYIVNLKKNSFAKNLNVLAHQKLASLKEELDFWETFEKSTFLE